MDHILISIVVPVYNAELYLEECISSILRQTYVYFELILIDDGSTDNSLIICRSFEKKDSRIEVFHQDNSGVSSARNLGIRLAHGEYICFVDADDWIDETYLSSFVESLLKNRNLDLCVQGLKSFENGKMMKRKKFIDELFESRNMSAAFEGGLISFRGPYCKLFKMSVLRCYNVKFPIELSYGEDSIFYLQYMHYIDTIQTISSAGYNYRRNIKTSLTSKCHTPEKLLLFYKLNEELMKSICSKFNLKADNPRYNKGKVGNIQGVLENAFCLNYSSREILLLMREIRFLGYLSDNTPCINLKECLVKNMLIYCPAFVLYCIFKIRYKLRFSSYMQISK